MNPVTSGLRFGSMGAEMRRLLAIITRLSSDRLVSEQRKNLLLQTFISQLVKDESGTTGVTRDVLQMLRDSGVRIVIDDFDTGYPSLYHLYELRFDKLKIDRHFIREPGATEESDIFTRAIVGPSNGLELCVTAEGVDTDVQVEAPSKLVAHEAQGFLFGKAMPASEVAQLLSVKPLQLVA
jgi:EAL domain-containing protein (putative c-di-GMP-specific phosphodiesterase class I)